MQLDDRAIYFEALTLGDLVRVAAIDAATGIEVVVSGPATAARFDLERLAKRKLHRALVEAGVLASEQDEGQGARSGPPASAPGRGKLV